MSPLSPAPRIALIGVSGAGKSTLASLLAGALGLPLVELDALNWEPGWTPAAPDVLRSRVAKAVRGDRWVIVGNYGQVRDLVWGRATHMIWLDVPLLLALWRVLTRTLGRAWHRELLWGTNRESLVTLFFRHESLLWWVLKTHGPYRRSFAAKLALPEYAHLRVLRIVRRRDAQPAPVLDWVEKNSPPGPVSRN